jgi:hypothetical protein
MENSIQTITGTGIVWSILKSTYAHFRGSLLPVTEPTDFFFNIIIDNHHRMEAGVILFTSASRHTKINYRFSEEYCSGLSIQRFSKKYGTYCWRK